MVFRKKKESGQGLLQIYFAQKPGLQKDDFCKISQNLFS